MLSLGSLGSHKPGIGGKRKPANLKQNLHLQLTHPPHNQTFSTRIESKCLRHHVRRPSKFPYSACNIWPPSPLILPLDVGKPLVPWHPQGHIIRQLKGQTIGPRNEL